MKTAKYRRNSAGSKPPRTVTQVTNAARIALNDPTIEFVRRKDRGLSYFIVLYGKHGMTEAMNLEPLWSNSLDEWVEKVRRAIEKAESGSGRGYGIKGLSFEILTSVRKNTAKYRRNSGKTTITRRIKPCKCGARAPTCGTQRPTSVSSRTFATNGDARR
jgi:hypothetical protein